MSSTMCALPLATHSIKTQSRDTLAPTLSLSALKKQLRDTQRALRSNRVAADTRIYLMRKEETLQARLLMAQQKPHTRDLSGRYKMVKLFESKKAARHFKSAVKDWLMCQSDEALRTRVLEAAKDVAYIANFPKNQPYVSLFAQGAFRAGGEEDRVTRVRLDEFSSNLVDESLFELLKEHEGIQTALAKLTNKTFKHSSEEEEDNDEPSEEDLGSSDGSDAEDDSEDDSAGNDSEDSFVSDEEDEDHSDDDEDEDGESYNSGDDDDDSEEEFSSDIEDEDSEEEFSSDIEDEESEDDEEEDNEKPSKKKRN